MTVHASRRTSIKASGAAVAGTALIGCGGDGPEEMTSAQQLALTSPQAVAAVRAGKLSAEG